jgi:hypothetical protein
MPSSCTPAASYVSTACSPNMKLLKSYQWNGWSVSKLQHPYSSRPRWVGELFDSNGALLHRAEKLSLKVLRQCIDLVNLSKERRQP